MIRINLLKPGIMVYNNSEPGGIIDIKHEIEFSHKPDLVEILWDKKDFEKKWEKNMGRQRKYCSYQPYLDYIGVSERERKEWNKEEEEQEKKMNLPFDKIHDLQSSFGHLIIPWFGKDRYGKSRWLAWFFIKGTFRKKGIKRTDKFGFHNCRIYGN